MAARKKKTTTPTLRRYSPEFKAKATRRVGAGETIAAVATDLGISANTLFVWKKKAETREAKPVTNGNGHTAAPLVDISASINDATRREVNALEVELRLVTAERDAFRIELRKALRGQG